MVRRFEELAWSETAMGAISLRRRLEPALEVDVYEVKLGDEFLMSSLFRVAEVELARLALAELPDAELDVVVGGLGLGYTACAVLEDPRVRRLTVVEALAEVIDWHERSLFPDAAGLTTDPRTRLVQADFFALAASPGGFSSGGAHERVDAVVVDIDHSPRHLLSRAHAGFYTEAGMRALADHLHPGGVFGLWSDDPPDAEFCAVLSQVFDSSRPHEVTFPNFYTGGRSANTVYVARTPAAPA